MNKDGRLILLDAIRKGLSGLTSRHRAEARYRGVNGGSVKAQAPLTELRRLVKLRLDGLRGAPEPASAAVEGWDGKDADDFVEPIVIDVPTLAELRTKWLPQLGIPLDGDNILLNVVVPPVRRAHKY